MIEPLDDAPKTTMFSIAKGVAEAYGLSLEQLRSPARVFRIAHPRHEAMYLIRQVTWPSGTPRYSLPHIGQFFNRDHSTVVQGIRAHKKRSNLP